MKGYFVRLIRDKTKPNKVHPRLQGIDEVEGYLVGIKDDNGKPQILFIFKDHVRIYVATGFVLKGWKQIEKTPVDISVDFVRTAKFMLNDITGLELYWEKQKKKS